MRLILHYLRRVLLSVLTLCALSGAAHAASGAPQLVSEPESTRAIALDLLTQRKEPFSYKFKSFLNEGASPRIILFALNVGHASVNEITADAENGEHRVYDLPVEQVSPTPNFEGMSSIVVILNENLVDDGDVLVRIRVRGIASNRVRLGIGHIGGGPDDDPGTRPTPARNLHHPVDPEPTPPGVAPATKVHVGLSANPSANEGFTAESIKARFIQSRNAGVSFVYFAPTWEQLEPFSPSAHERYDFAALDFHLQLAGSANLPLVLNLRVIDTNQRSMPADLRDLAFDDGRVRQRLLDLVDALAPRLKERVPLVMIGNEVNAYFAGRGGEIDAYKTLYLAGAGRFKQAVPGVLTSVNLTFDGLVAGDPRLRSLSDISDFLSVTYYPLYPDFTVKEPEMINHDFINMIGAANGKKVLLQEAGYPSSVLNDSSEEKQAKFIDTVFDNLTEHKNYFWGANFFLMSDLPDDVVNDFAKYYNFPHSERFKAFLKTLGMFDDQGKAKKSWNSFYSRASKNK